MQYYSTRKDEFKMKKLISLLCVLAMTVAIVAIGVVSASADVPSTVLDVKKGDTVKYSLALSDVPERIVGCDFSVYYDADAFKLDSVADFSDSTNDEDWQATINPDLKGEVRGNWSILKGVDFSKKRNIVTLNLTAQKDTSAHISYFVRYMYDNTVFDSPERPQIDQYQFACDVSVNGAAVIQNAQPELNVEEEQPNGLFDNSRTGSSKDADVALSGDSIKANGGASGDISGYEGRDNVNVSVDNDSNGNSGNNGGNSGNSGNNGGNNSGNSGNNSGNNGGNSGNSGSTDNKNAPKATDKQSGTVVDQSVLDTKKSGGSAEKSTIAATDAEGNPVETTGSAVSSEKKDDGGSSAMMWIIIGAIILIAGGCIAYVVVKGKKGKDGAVQESSSDDDKTISM